MENELLDSIRFTLEWERKRRENVFPTSLTFTKEILSYLVNKLQNQQMSLFVGAGFSRNAGDEFLDWNTLLVDAVKEMNLVEQEPNETLELFNKRIKEYIENNDPTVIAEQYVNFKKDRKELDLFIEQKLAEPNFKVCNAPENPALDLHKKLLEINWYDIATTNYDTLLEAVNTNDKYQVVTKAKDLRLNNKKRIVKLHGTLRKSDEEPLEFDDNPHHAYIMTQTDFQNYHNEHGLFSKFMEVEILQTAFCLIGFSGKDPNFIYWVNELKKAFDKAKDGAEPNKIILIDVDDSELSLEQEQEYADKNIKRVTLSDLLSVIETEDYDCAYELYKLRKENGGGLSIKQKFDVLFDYLKRKSVLLPHRYVQENFDLFLSDVSKKETITVEQMNEYLEKDLFYFESLTASDIRYNIYNTFKDINSLTETHFEFLYKFCENNYYSLDIFNLDFVDSLWDFFKNNLLQNTKSLGFVELILKFYRERNPKKFNEIIEVCKDFDIGKFKNIISYELALYHAENYEYEKLQTVLKNWHPEEASKNSLYILRKIGLYSIYDSVKINFDRNDFEHLFEVAERVCKNKQLLLFIYQLHDRYLLVNGSGGENNKKTEIKELTDSGCKQILDYVNAILKTKSENISPNEKTRYAVDNNENRQRRFEISRLMNFSEYTGIPFSLLQTSQEIENFVYYFIDDTYFLVKKIFPNSLAMFGKSADEETLRGIVPKILRSVNSTVLKSLYQLFFEIIKYQLSCEINPKQYIYIENEIIQRLQNEDTNEYIAFFVSQIKSNNIIVISNIQNGNMWGWKKPFLCILPRITNTDDYKFLLDWIIDEYLLDMQGLGKRSFSNSVFFDYYFELLQNPLILDCLTVFNAKIESVYKQDLDFKADLCLYGYEHIQDGQLKEKISLWLNKNYSKSVNPYFLKYVNGNIVCKEKIKDVVENYVVGEQRPQTYSILSILSNAFDNFDFDDKELLQFAKKLKANAYIHNKNIGNNEGIVYRTLYFSYDLIRREFNVLLDDFAALFNETRLKYFSKNDFIKNPDAWIYSETLVQKKEKYVRLLEYLSYSDEIEKYKPYIIYMLNQILVVDSNENEAVLEHFLNFCNAKQNNDFIKKEYVKSVLISIKKKFSFFIPLCYDDIFIKKQIARIDDLYRAKDSDNVSVSRVGKVNVSTIKKGTNNSVSTTGDEDVVVKRSLSPKKIETKVYYGEYSLSHWIDLLISGNIVLPSYQRSFVWKDRQVNDLMNSFYKNDFIPPVTIGIFKTDIEGNVINYIIDGQQRLTSLLLAKLGYFPNSKNFPLPEDEENGISDSDKEIRMGWTMKNLLSSGNVTVIEDVQKKLGEYKDRRYRKLNLNTGFSLTDEFLETHFLGFSCIVLQTTDRKIQQAFYSTTFRNINAKGKGLSPLESRRSLYFIDDEIKDLFEPTHIINGITVNGKTMDFTRYLAILSNYKKTVKEQQIAMNIGNLEKAYEEFIRYVQSDNVKNTSNKFCAIKELKKNFNNYNDMLEKNIELLGLRRNFSTIVECDVYFFGLIYLIYFERQIMSDALNFDIESCKTELANISEYFSNKGSEHLKTPNSIKHIQKRVEKSLEIYEKYASK